MTAEWTQVLDEFEARVVAAEAVVEAGGDADPPAPFAQPALDSALPGPLAERARELLERAQGVTERIQADQDRVREELARLPRRAAEGASRTGSKFEFQA